ncbi:hypothetical protein [Halodesulfovibrio aestuarii]|uniref:Uncharacterized protein n=1 Tax=Halodesulfovibrio aestuarii TaxID=126333 RepID=A0A8G2C7W5_9BACT|nr:hypothetical protein [Halodesulfovibrio aestuarii]SHI71522.1 hypothetical protein SAMN05660830_00751 [Halodesulfovibrio aestuarii]
MSREQKTVQLSGTLQPWIKNCDEPEGLMLVTTTNDGYVVEENRSGLNLLSYIGEWLDVSGYIRRDGQLDYLVIRSASVTEDDLWQDEFDADWSSGRKEPRRMREKDY